MRVICVPAAGKYALFSPLPTLQVTNLLLLLFLNRMAQPTPHSLNVSG